MKNKIKINPVLVRHTVCTGLSDRAAEVFSEEIQQKTGCTLVESGIYLDGRSNIVLCCQADFAEVAGIHQAELKRLTVPGVEGYRIFSVLETDASYSIFVVGADPRGVFYGMGRLLRELYLTEDGIFFDALMKPISSTPQYPLRGHQLGYRDKQNTCPCWDQQDYDRYIRDLGIFGSNAIELVAPNTDDYLFSRVMQVHPMKMMCDVSKIIHSYGMDVWLWYPNMAPDYSDPAVMARELAEREEVYSKIPYLEDVLIPAGDPGDLLPGEFFRVTGIFAKVLHRHHPNARIWIAPQCFEPDEHWMPDFYAEVDRIPDWLYGLCYGPWNKDTLPEMHQRLPKKYKSRIRFYPDITHNMGSQYPMHNWDTAFAVIEGRECNNTRPRAMKYIHNLFSPMTVGSLTYSEGIHDDVNKFVWGQQDWDSNQSSVTTLREYVRYFIDPALENELTAGFLALEENWVCEDPIELNTKVDDTYRLWCNLESLASPKTRENYRYQMGLLRALSDYYIKHKQIYDHENERRAISILQAASEETVDESIRAAVGALNRSTDEAWDEMIRNRILYLADSLNEKCGIKLTTKRHNGQYWGRGAYLDFIDFPLNNAPYLLNKLRKIFPQKDSASKIQAISKLLNRTNPGIEGIYCNAGSREGMRYFTGCKSWQSDPSLHRTPYATLDRVPLRIIFDYNGTHREMDLPQEWQTRMVTYYDTPITARFEGLDPAARYRLKIVYMEAQQDIHVRLTAGDGTVIHSMIEAKKPFNPVYEFLLEPKSYENGIIDLTWQPEKHFGGVSINEIFILKE